MNNKRLIGFGLIGALLVGISDFLLGYVDPVTILDSSLIRVGHGVDYNLDLPYISMLVASVGMIFYVFMFWGISNTITNDKLKKIFIITAICGFFGWLMIHYYVASLVYQYAWGIQNGIDIAFEYTSAILDYFSSIIFLWYFIVIIPFVIHFIATITGNTNLSKFSMFGNPLLCLVYIGVLLSILPDTKLSSAIQMGIASEAIFIWVVVLLLSKRKEDSNSIISW